jgi:hypothetical protein
MGYNFDALKKVETSNPRGGTSNYDLKYFKKNNQFAVGTGFFEENNLEDKGMTLFNSPNPSDPVFIGLAPEEDSIFLKKKEGAENKGRRVTNRMLRKALDNAGIKTVEMKLEAAGEHEDYEMFVVKPVEESGLYEEDESEDDEDLNVEDEILTGDEE